MNLNEQCDDLLADYLALMQKLEAYQQAVEDSSVSEDIKNLFYKANIDLIGATMLYGIAAKLVASAGNATDDAPSNLI